MRDQRKFEELLPEEFDAEVKRHPIIYCAFGPMEYHGIYNALGIDPGKAYEICLRAAGLSGGIVFPLVPLAPGGSMSYEKMLNRDELRKVIRSAYPSVMTSVALCEKLYYELFESFAEDLGFKVCVAFGGHGPAGVLIKKIASDHNGAIAGMKLLPCGSLSHNLDTIKAEYAKLGVNKISHGGLWETAMNMACNPEFVQLERAQKKWPEIFEKYTVNLEGLNKVTPEIVLALGEKLLNISAERIAAEATALLNR